MFDNVLDMCQKNSVLVLLSPSANFILFPSSDESP